MPNTTPAEPRRVQDICQRCGSTEYTRADMVGDVCPGCVVTTPPLQTEPVIEEAPAKKAKASK